MTKAFLRKTFALIAVIGMLQTPVAHAAIDEAGAQAAKTTVEEALDLYIKMAQATGEGLKLGGPVAVAPKGSYYEITLPDVNYTTKESGVFKIGTVKINATPDANGDYRTSIALPEKMTLDNTAGKTIAEVMPGSQKFSGVWRPALGTFFKFDAEYSNTSIKFLANPAEGLDDPISVGIAKASASMDLSEAPQSAWSGPKKTTIEGMRVSFGPNSADSFSLGSFNATMDIKGMDMSIPRVVRDKLREKMADGKELTPEQAQEIFKTSFEGLAALPMEMHTKTNLSDVAIDIKPRPAKGSEEKAVEGFSAQLASLSSQSSFTGIKAERGTANGKAVLSGLKVSNAPAEFAGLIPSDVSVGFESKDIPSKAIADSIYTVIDDTLSNAGDESLNDDARKNEAKMKAQQALASLPAMLSAAGTTFEIRDTFTKSADLSSSVNGLMKATAGAPYVFTGKMTTTFSGLDELIVKFQDMAKNSNDQKVAGYAQMLTLLQLSGQLGQGADGKSQRIYAFELTPDGKALLNGADIKGMAGMMKGSAPAPTQPAPTP